MPTMPPTFRPQGQPTRAERARQHDSRRGSARQRGYTARWDRQAAAFRAAHPLCLGCEALGLVEPTTLVDHTVPHKGDDALFWDRGNWQASCAWHHSTIKQILERRYEAGEIDAAELRLDSETAKKLGRDGVGGG